jgi:hypothetical protein
VESLLQPQAWLAAEMKGTPTRMRARNDRPGQQCHCDMRGGAVEHRKGFSDVEKQNF